MPKLIRVVALTVSSELGGTERVLLDLAKHHRDLGLDLSVVLPKDGPLMKELEGYGVATHVVMPPNHLLSMSRTTKNPLRYLQILPALLKWASRLRNSATVKEADLIYSIGFKTHLVSCLLRSKPKVWHLHEFPPRRTAFLWRTLGRVVPAKLIANSTSVKDAWQTIRQKHDAVPIALNGVDLDRFKPQPPTKWIHQELDIPKGQLLLGMPAVFASWKGHVEVMEAFLDIQNEFPNLDLVFVGGPIYDTTTEKNFSRQLEQRLQNAPPDENGRQRVHTLPFQRDVERVYPEFEITLHYSLRPEPFGRVVIESMACGVPVIAADEGGPREIMRAGQHCGWLAPPRDVSSLTQTLRQALSSTSTEKEKLALEVRRRAEESFSSLRFASDVLEVFQNVTQDEAG